MTILDSIPEYQQMRKGLMALRLEAPPLVVDDLLVLCEKAVHAVREIAYSEGYTQASDEAGL